MRWSLRLSEFDFDIEHVPGTKIRHVDALSRHVGLVEENQLLSKERILKEQDKDPFCEKQKSNGLKAKGEFFLDLEGVLYRRQKSKQPQLVVTQSMVQEVINANHTPIFVAHPGSKRTFELISIRYWWPRMRQDIEDFVKRCEKCQTRKGKCEMKAPLGQPEEPTEPFQVTSMDITGPYCLTPRKNQYILTFIDHFTKFVEIFPIPDVSAETCARVYATQIVAKHGSGSTLITDQGRAFTSAFFQQTCKILKIRKVKTSAYHPMSNGMIESSHRVLHDSMAHYVDSSGTNWDVVLPFFLMAYRATPHSTTKYGPFYLLHGREMLLPNVGDLKAKVSSNSQDVDQTQRLENLKSSLLRPYKAVRLNNRKSHQENKVYYDKKAKERKFEVYDEVYLFCPAKKPGKCQKFRSYWRGPYIIVQKLSDLNYKIMEKKGNEFVVHVNRLKKSYDPTPWNIETVRCPRPKVTPPDPESSEEIEVIQSRPMVNSEERDPRVDEPQTVEEEPLQLDQIAETAGVGRNMGRRTPDSSVQDPDFAPSNSPHARRELAATPIAPRATRSRAKLQLQENLPVN
jgi:hypothetical protein